MTGAGPCPRGLDHAAFGRDLLRGLAELGASERALARLKISLRAGSVVASLHGPSAALLELRGLPLARLSVQGCMAEVLGAGAEEGREAAGVDVGCGLGVCSRYRSPGIARGNFPDASRATFRTCG